MKKIAMVNCLKANDVCTGAGCLRAFYDKTGGFERYGDEELQLMAFMRCSQCYKGSVDPRKDPDFLEKLERFIRIGVETVHIGVCAFDKESDSPCPGMRKMADAFAENGMDIVWKTH